MKIVALSLCQLFYFGLKVFPFLCSPIISTFIHPLFPSTPGNFRGDIVRRHVPAQLGCADSALHGRPGDEPVPSRGSTGDGQAAASCDLLQREGGAGGEQPVPGYAAGPAERECRGQEHLRHHLGLRELSTSPSMVRLTL